MKLLEQVVVVARRRRLAQNTIDVYCLWIRQFLAFSAQRHGAWKPPEQLGTGDVEAFLNDMVMRRRLSASAQNQAFRIPVASTAPTPTSLPPPSRASRNVSALTSVPPPFAKYSPRHPEVRRSRPPIKIIIRPNPSAHATFTHVKNPAVDARRPVGSGNSALPLSSLLVTPSVERATPATGWPDGAE